MSTIDGTAGNDLLAGTSGSDTFNGFTGFDTAQVAAASGDAVFSLDPQGRWQLASPQGIDTLDSIEAVQLTDGVVTLGLEQFPVNTATALDQTQPVLASLPGGGFLATWLTGAGVRIQRFDGAGVPSGAELAAPMLGPQPNVAPHHDSAALADGGFLIAAVAGEMSSYTDRYGTHWVVVPVIAAMRFGADGAFAGAWAVAQGQRTADSSLEVGTPSLTALSDGNFLVTWTASFATSHGGSGASFVARRLDSSGAPLGGSVTLPVAPWTTDVAALPGGGYAVAWSTGADVLVRHFHGTGAPAADAVAVGAGSYGSRPQIATLADGSGVVAWLVQSGEGFDLYARRLDATGNALGPADRINTGPVSDSAAPAVTALADGGYVVAWTVAEQDGSSTDIHAQRFDSQGAPAGGETLVDAVNAGLQQQPVLTALEGGGFVVGWMSSGPGTDGWDIEARRFDASGVAVPSGHALQGDGNANTLRFAGSERVQLLGAGGNDVLQGGSGDDLLDGGAGTDSAWRPDLHAALTWQLAAGQGLRVTGPLSGSDALVSVEQVLAQGARVGVGFEPATQVRLVEDHDAPYALLQAPAAAVLADGSSVVVWERHGTEAGLYVGRFDASGSAAGAIARIDGWKAAIAALEDGGYVLAWSLQPEPNGSAAIDAQRFDAGGSPAGPVVRVAADVGDPTQAPVVAALPGGGYAVAWIEAAYPADSLIFTRHFDSSGLPSSPATRVNTTAGPYPGEQSIAVLQDGSSVVTWTMGDPQTWPGEPGYDIYAQRFAGDGMPIGGEARVNTVTSGHQLRPDVTALADGGYLVTWMNYIYTDRSIKAQRFDAGGAAVGGEVSVNLSTPHSDASGPVVAALADGGYVIGWTSADGSASGITVQRFDAAGARVGGESRVNASAAGDQTQPALAALADGGYMVTWLSQHGDTYAIDTQRFDANNLREGHLTLSGGADDNVLRVTSASEGVELVGGGGRDILAAAAGWDVLTGGTGGDTFEFAAAGNGVDTITDWGFGDRISVAGAGFTGVVTAGSGEAVALNAVQASAAAGHTTLYIGTDATPGADVVIRLAGSFAADSFTLNGNLIEAPPGLVVTGRRELAGGPGDDTLIALHGFTRMAGGAGDDTYVLGNPNDRVIEQADGGVDEVRSAWNGTLGAHVERLVLTGGRPVKGTGNDLDNVITGNGARNVITGGRGVDTLGGGGGADLFVYRSVDESGAAPGSWDLVLDFSSAEGDRIDLRGIDANPGRPGKQGFAFIGAADFSSTDATGQLRFDAATHLLYASIDADARAEMAIELAGVTMLEARSLVL